MRRRPKPQKSASDAKNTDTPEAPGAYSQADAVRGAADRVRKETGIDFAVEEIAGGRVIDFLRKMYGEAEAVTLAKRAAEDAGRPGEWDSLRLRGANMRRADGKLVVFLGLDAGVDTVIHEVAERLSMEAMASRPTVADMVRRNREIWIEWMGKRIADEKWMMSAMRRRLSFAAMVARMTKSGSLPALRTITFRVGTGSARTTPRHSSGWFASLLAGLATLFGKSTHRPSCSSRWRWMGFSKRDLRTS